MQEGLHSFYAEWRIRCGVAPLLREDRDSPPEQLLQAIWQHQRLLRDQLKTLDGQPVRVLHPGFRSVEGGPDFRGALVQIGDGPARTGDVEVDLQANGWHAHGHDRNPAFEQVILHVVWESEQPKAGQPPRLLLWPVLDAPLGELSVWLAGETGPSFPEALRGQCCAPLRKLKSGETIELLLQAARVRLRSKASQFAARARQVGWEQSLWEGLFRALGYKHNTWPMQRLAELRDGWSALPADRFTVEARLLGLSGLLPADLNRTDADTGLYLRRIWDHWWREQDAFSDRILPRAVWHLHGLRPANHPQRRLALAAGWSASGELLARIEVWCAQAIPARALPGSLLEVLQVEPDDFWTWHWTLRSGRLPSPQPPLGTTRATDLAVNVVLPWLWIRATEGKNDTIKNSLEHRYFNWPPAQDNSVLRLARHRLLGGVAPQMLPGAAAQQGLIQIVRDFCDHSNSVCQNCKLPELVREFVSCETNTGRARAEPNR